MVMHQVFKCENYKSVDNVLTVFNGELVGMVKDKDGFNILSNMIVYNAIVCPALYSDENGNKCDIVVFVNL
jgi:hypothetical protein